MMRNILVVDDHRGSRQALTELLVSEGYQVSEAQDGRSALALFRHKQTDAAVLDYTLPDTNGVRLMQQLRAQAPELPVIVVSGSATYQVDGMRIEVDNHRQEATRAGATAFLPKPIPVDDLLDALDQAAA